MQIIGPGYNKFQRCTWEQYRAEIFMFAGNCFESSQSRFMPDIARRSWIGCAQICGRASTQFGLILEKSTATAVAWEMTRSCCLEAVVMKRRGKDNDVWQIKVLCRADV